MTRHQAKQITFSKCLFRQVHLDGTPFLLGRTNDTMVLDDFQLFEMTITSTPIVAKVTKLKPGARIRYGSPSS